MPRDYAKDLFDQGKITRADYDRLLMDRARDEDAINRRLSEAARNADARKRQALKGIGDGGREWQAELEAW